MVLHLFKNLFVGPAEIKILQWNCNGIRSKRESLLEYLEKNRIDVALIQETHLNPHHRFDLGCDYVVHRQDRPSHKGGVMSVFHRKYTRVYEMRIRTPDGVEGQSWAMMGSGFKIMLHNWYCPPRSKQSVKQLKKPTLKAIIPYMRVKALLVGDFNCKSHWWGYTGSDSLGRSMQDLVVNHDVKFLNQKKTVTLPAHRTTPDLTLATPDIADYLKWEVGDRLGSDHRTIIITYSPTSRISQTRKRRQDKNRIAPCARPKKTLSAIVSLKLKRFVRRLMLVVKPWLVKRKLK